MKSIARIQWLALIVLVSVALQAHGDEKVQKAAKTTYLVVYERGPAWVGKTLAEQKLQEHGRYLLDLYERGALKLAGGFLDDSGGAVVLEAENEASAKAIVANDPAVKQGTFVAQIRPWGLQPWDVHLQRRRERERNDQ